MEAWLGFFLAVGPWACYSVSAVASSSVNMGLMIVTSPRVSGRINESVNAEYLKESST